MNIILVIVLTLLGLLFVRPLNGVSVPLKIGQIYSNKDASGNTVPMDIGKVLFNEQATKENVSLQTIDLKSSIALPEKFIARIVPSGKYEIFDPLARTEPIQQKIKVSNSSILKAPHKPMPVLSTKAPEINGSVENHESDGLQKIRNYLKDTQLSFYFSDKSIKVKNVELRVISITPYNDSDILSFQIINNQKEYFFIESIKFTINNSLVVPKSYFQPMVPNERDTTSYLVIPHQGSSAMSLTVVESGGKGRTFTVNFKSN